jgi:hypothetical protein
VVTFPFEVGDAVLLNDESIVGFPFYVMYYQAYNLNKRFPHSSVPGFNGTMSWLQRQGLHADEGWDQFENWSGYPGAKMRDERMTVNYLPSIIHPYLTSGGWRMGKITYWRTTFGPGLGSNGKEDFAD